MKKLFVLILALLMTTLVFASCDTGEEEKSSEPVSEVSSVEKKSEVPSTEVSSKSEEESSGKNSLFADIVTEEDKQYYSEFLIFQPISFTDVNELTYEDLTTLYYCMITEDSGVFEETFDPICRSLMWGETHSFPVSKVERVLQTYLGDYPFAEKLRGGETVNTKYNAKTDTIDVIGEYFSRGGYVGDGFPLPVERTGDLVAIRRGYGESKLIRVEEVLIREFEDGFHILKISELTEEEIADLNEKYFGEA